MKKLLTMAFALALTASLSFAQTSGSSAQSGTTASSGQSSDQTGSTTTTTKKHHRKHHKKSSTTDTGTSTRVVSIRRSARRSRMVSPAAVGVVRVRGVMLMAGAWGSARFSTGSSAVKGSSDVPSSAMAQNKRIVARNLTRL